MVHLKRLVLASLLGCLCSVLGGCLLTGLKVGFNLAPPGAYFDFTLEGTGKLESIPPPETQASLPGQGGTASPENGVTATLPAPADGR